MPSASCSEKVAATFLCPRSCGFARVATLVLGRKVSAELLKEEKEGQAKFCARKLQEHYKRYTQLFKDEEDSFQIDFAKFRKKLPQLRDFFNPGTHGRRWKKRNTSTIFHLKVGVNCRQKGRGNIVLLIEGMSETRCGDPGLISSEIQAVQGKSKYREYLFQKQQHRNPISSTKALATILTD